MTARALPTNPAPRTTGPRHPAPRAPAPSRRRRYIIAVAALAVLAAIVMDTKVVRVGSAADMRQQAFSPDGYGTEAFPRIQAFVRERAVDAPALAAAIAADKDAAVAAHGTPASTGAIMAVRVVGVAGEPKAGIYPLTVDGMPEGVSVRIQTGPAINGTDLRDAPGDIVFGGFKNQIEYQDAGAAINRAMKAAVLDPVDTTALTGKTVEVVGAFRLINPKNWLITPVGLTVR